MGISSNFLDEISDLIPSGEPHLNFNIIGNPAFRIGQFSFLKFSHSDRPVGEMQERRQLTQQFGSR